MEPAVEQCISTVVLTVKKKEVTVPPMPCNFPLLAQFLFESRSRHNSRPKEFDLRFSSLVIIMGYGEFFYRSNECNSGEVFLVHITVANPHMIRLH